MDIRRKMLTISEESVETCFMLNDHACKTALAGNCPHSTCKDAYEKAAASALKDIERKPE